MLYLEINSIKFKAYLEDSQESFDIKNVNVPAVSPRDFIANVITTKVLKKVKFVFNVMSENYGECLKNYENLAKLITSLKPKYTYEDSQFLPDTTNLYGNTKVNFAGFPGSSTEIDLQITNFSYEINKEIGFIRYNKKIIPLAFKISIEGRRIQPFEDQVRIINLRKKSEDELAKAERSAEEASGDEAEQEKHLVAKLALINAIKNGSLRKDVTDFEITMGNIFEQHKSSITYDLKIKKITSSEFKKQLIIAAKLYDVQNNTLVTKEIKKLFN